jgi:hypothetical protein
MGLQVAVAAPFKQRGTDRIAESEFVVALSLDRDWFSPDQAKRLIDVAVGQDLLRRDDDDLVAEFARSTVEVPADFVPDESLLQEQSTFERVLDAAVAAGTDKQTAVAGINETQADLAVSVEAAAVVYARAAGLDAAAAAARAREELAAPSPAGADSTAAEDDPGADQAPDDDGTNGATPGGDDGDRADAVPERDA